MFPSVTQLLESEGTLWLLSPSLVLFALVRRHYARKLGRTRRFETLVLLAVGGVGCAAMLVSAANALYFRLDPFAVVEMEIATLRGSEPTDRVCVLSDTTAIQAGLATLGAARAFSNNHETLSDGYVVRLKSSRDDVSTGRNLFVFPSTSAGRRVDVVIPRTSRRGAGMLVEAGQYSSPEFATWLTQIVESARCAPGRGNRASPSGG